MSDAAGDEPTGGRPAAAPSERDGGGLSPARAPVGETPVPSGGPAFPAAAAVAAPATGAPLPATGAAAQGLTPCPAAGCADQVQGGPEGDALALHLRRHAMREVPAIVAARLNLVACPHCDRPFRGRTGARGRSSHSSHVSQCAQNPRRRLVRPAAAPAVPAAAPAAAGAAQERGGSGCGGGREDLFGSDFAAWRRRREDFLRVAAPDADAWPALVAAGVRTMDCVPAALLPAWRRLMAEALDWARTEPEREHAWLWLLLLPSLLLHQPSASSLPARRGARDTHAARAVAVLAGELGAALAARDAGIWRPLSDPGPPQRIPSTPGWGGVGAPAPLPAAPWLAGGPSPPPCATSAQRRALRQARHGRLSAAARTLLSEPPAPRTPAVWAKAQQLFPPSSPDLATAASVEAAFPEELAALAAAAGQLAVPRTVSRDTVTLAIRAAPRGSSPGPSGLRALVGVVLLLTGEAAVTRVPSVARTALAGADLLLLRKPGGLAADGLPKLRPIGMPEALRKLAASALARTVRDAAAALLGPHQQGVGVRSACERVLHELRAQLAACPTQAAVQLDFSNAFNRVSRTAARVVGERTLPLLTPYFDWVYGGEGPPVYGWAEEADAGPPPTTPNPTLPLRGRPHVPVSAPVSAVQRPAPRRLSLRAERGAQQGDPLGPLLHALALQLPLLRLARGCPRLLIRAFHDDVVAVGPTADLARFVGAAGVAGAAIDAALAPAKCVGWSPTPQAAPEGWSAQWRADGLVQFSVPLGGDDFLSAGVDAIAADHSRLVAAISQLHLLRLCAGPRANFWLRALPLVWGARLAGAVDRDARSALTALLCDAADPPARRAALLERAALPVAMGGLGIGGRVRVAPAAALASWLDALRAGRAYSPALRAVAAALSERPVVAADGGPVAPPPPPTSLPSAARADPAAVPSSAAAGLAAPPLTAEEVAAGLRAARAAAPGGESGLVWDSGGRVLKGTAPLTSPLTPPSRTSAGPELVAGPEPLAAQMVARVAARSGRPQRPRPVRGVGPLAGRSGGAARHFLDVVGRPTPRRRGSAPTLSPPLWRHTPSEGPSRPRADRERSAVPAAVPPPVGVDRPVCCSATPPGGREALVSRGAGLPCADACASGPGPGDATSQPAGPAPLPAPPPRALAAHTAPPCAAPGLVAELMELRDAQAAIAAAPARDAAGLLAAPPGRGPARFSLPAHAAARARLYEELTLHGRARLAACQGGGAGRWLAALPLPGPGGAAFSGDAMRVAVRLWLGVAPRSAPPGHRCRCGAEVDAEGRHFLGPCLALKRRATHLHTTIVKQVEGALGEAGVWRDVVVEPELYPGAPESLRPDLRATRVTSGRRTWADVSLASPLEARELARVAAAPLAPLAAAKRERGKAAKYEAALPAATPPSEFAPLVWETFGRVGPATAAFLRSALGGPGGTTARSALLRGVSPLATPTVCVWTVFLV
ncbi:hypothetical protein MMPV_010009 [Pyropia vietnamensis]